MYLRFLLAMGLLVYCTVATSAQEQHRPRFHFTPPAHWMNDPNGMVYYAGEYHLFYQYYPDSTVWGPMHWGHAVSSDLMHWTHLPIALYPDTLGYIFSGSVVVDTDNATKFAKLGDETPLVAMFTYHDMVGERAKRNDFQTQGIAYSVDKGRTWTKYTQNPVIKNSGIRDFRDPKIFWHDESKTWHMVLAVADHVSFYSSTDLKKWDKTGDFGNKDGEHGGVWECPDLFQLPVEESEQTAWVLVVNIGNGAPNGGSGTQYFVGDFDGKTFTNTNPPEKKLWLDYGKDNYAGVTWSNVTDSRRLFLGWMSNWQYATSVPTLRWRSANTIPRELSLREIPDSSATRTNRSLRLVQRPVSEMSLLNTQLAKNQTVDTTEVTLTGKTLQGVKIVDNQSVSKEIVLELDLTLCTATDFGVTLRNNRGEKVDIGYDVVAKQFYINRLGSGKTDFSKDFAVRQVAPRLSSSLSLKLHLVIDVASVELFADDGSVVMTSIFFPNEDFNITELFAKIGKVQCLNGYLRRLNGSE